MSKAPAERAYSIMATILAACVMMAGTSGAAFADKRSDFIAAGRCKVANLFHLIHGHREEQNRFS